MSTDNLPPGAVRTPVGMMTVANAETNARTAPVAPKAPIALPPWLSGVLGVLALVAGIPVAIVAALPTAGLSVPAWLVTAAAVGGAVSPLFTGLAFWAAGGNPLELLKRPTPVTAPTPRVGPPEP